MEKSLFSTVQCIPIGVKGNTILLVMLGIGRV